MKENLYNPTNIESFSSCRKSIFNNLNIYGEIPKANIPETEQFYRVLSILNKKSKSLGAWNKLLIDYKYRHHEGKIIDDDHDWNGQIDLILFSQYKIIIYELKGFTVKIIGGSTNQSEWLVKKRNRKNLIRMTSPFTQVSRQRAHLLYDIFVSELGCTHNHWVIDGRVVFKNNSTFDGFWFFPPGTISKESFDSDYLSIINNKNDRASLIDFYSETERKTDKLKLRNLDFKTEASIIRRLFKLYDLPIRTKKWFNIITENQIIDDMDNSGSVEFNLEESEAEALIESMSAGDFI